MPGFEPGAFRSQSGRATKLRHIPLCFFSIAGWFRTTDPRVMGAVLWPLSYGDMRGGREIRTLDRGTPAAD